MSATTKRLSGQAGPVVRQRHRRLELRDVVVAEVADDRQPERLAPRRGRRAASRSRRASSGRAGRARPTRAGTSARAALAQAEVGPERGEQVGGDRWCVMARKKTLAGLRSSGTGCARLAQRRLPPRSLRQATRCARTRVIAGRVGATGGRVKGRLRAVPLPDLLRELLTTPGPSGHEARRRPRSWREAAEAFAEVTPDALGSSTARVKGTADGPSLALVGHIDEIGLAVTHIDDKGFLYFRGVGGWLPEVLLAQRVEVHGEGGRIPGVIGKKRGPFKTRQGREDRAQGSLHRHRRARRRRGALGRAARRRRRARAAAGRASRTTASRRGRGTTASAATSRSRRRAASPRPAARPATSSRSRRSARRSATSPARARRRIAVRPDVAIAIDVTCRADIPRPSSRRGATSASGRARRSRAARR